MSSQACAVAERMNAMAAQRISPADEKRVKAEGFLRNKGTDNFNGRVITVNGRLNAQQMERVAKAAELFGNGQVAMTVRLTLEVQGIPYEKIESFKAYLAEGGLTTGGTGPKVRPVVSCKGTTCQYGLLDSFALSEKIHHRFYEGYHNVKLPHKFKIAVGGCPNNCVKPDLNDLGIIGQLTPAYDEAACRGCKTCAVEQTCPMKAAKLEGDRLQLNQDICNSCGRCVKRCPFHALGEGVPGYKVMLGGRWGKQTAMGRPLSRLLRSEEEVLSVVESAILLYLEQGVEGERFATTIERIGFDRVEAQLLDGSVLRRKEQILQGVKA